MWSINKALNAFRSFTKTRKNPFNNVESLISPGGLVVQVGANDGVMCDPLRAMFQSPRSPRAVLIEPIPYYFEKLKRLYDGNNRITVCNLAIGNEEGSRNIYFIDPDIADEMNGVGPPNNWAHGQGSFNKDIVVEHIIANRFRGEKYVQNLEKYIAAIKQYPVPIKKLSTLFLELDIPDIDLLLMDVQGFELEVIKSINFEIHKPKHIIYEDDLTIKNTLCADLLTSNGYKYVCGNADKLFRAV